MGQQPNRQIPETERPRQVLEPPPAGRWRPLKPGLITAPEQVPTGFGFGVMTPDAGYALRIVAGSDVPDTDPAMRQVLAALMTARAGLAGRAPVREDLEVALAICGLGYQAPDEVVARRERWREAVSHEIRPGETAVAEVDPDLLGSRPEQVRWALTRTGAETGPG